MKKRFPTISKKAMQREMMKTTTTGITHWQFLKISQQTKTASTDPPDNLPTFGVFSVREKSVQGKVWEFRKVRATCAFTFWDESEKQMVASMDGMQENDIMRQSRPSWTAGAQSELRWINYYNNNLKRHGHVDGLTNQHRLWRYSTNNNEPLDYYILYTTVHNHNCQAGSKFFLSHERALNASQTLWTGQRMQFHWILITWAAGWANWSA